MLTLHPHDAPPVQSFLTTTDPIDDLLLWADVASPLGRHARVWLAPEGLAYAFPLWGDRFAIGVKGPTLAAETALLNALPLPEGFVICDAPQLPAYEATGTCRDPFRESHMLLRTPPGMPDGVRPATLDELEAFYRANPTPAWNPLQYETGPAYIAEADGRIVAAATTQFAYPALAQIGNVMTDPAHRGRGHARRVTAAVAQALFARGHRVVSLFVAEANAPARRLYERLGFEHHRFVYAFSWHRICFNDDLTSR